MVLVSGIPLSRLNSVKTKYRLICCAIVMIVLLRVGIGWHFLYEAVVKFDPAKNFSSEGFLGVAKGPTAELYYWMLADYDGIQRLEIGEVESGRLNAEGAPIMVQTFTVYEDAWKDYFRTFLTNHSPQVSEADAEEIITFNIAKLVEWLVGKKLLSEEEGERVAKMNVAQISEWERSNKEDDEPKSEAKKIVRTKRIFDRYLGSLRADAADENEDVKTFKASRERFLETRNNIRNTASFEQERRWRQRSQLRAEAGYWIRKFNTMGDSLQSDLGRSIDLQLAGQKGEIVTAPEKELIPPHPLLEEYGIQYTIPPNPYVRSRIQAMDWAVKIGLFAIGICLITGFCTRLACLGGAAFLLNVVLTTFPMPGIYPPIPEVAGSSMFVSKDVVELLALLVLALMPAGRWGGLDYFLWHYGGKHIVGLFCASAYDT